MIRHYIAEFFLRPSRLVSIPYLLAVLVFGSIVLVLLHVGYSLPVTVQLNGSMVHYIWLDNIPRAKGNLAGVSGQFTAHMNRPPSGAIWLENTFQAQVTLSLKSRSGRGGV